MVLFSACIGDDFLDDEREPEIRITTILDSVEVNTSVMMEAMYLNNVGVEEEVAVDWFSSNPSIATIDNNGLLDALSFGRTTISVNYMSADITVADSILIVVGESTTNSNTDIMGEINTTSSYKLRGSFTLSEKMDQSGLTLMFEDDYCASTALPGLYVYLSNNRNNVASGYEIGRVNVFDGVHEYDIPDVGINDYAYVVYFCKPFNVKVGDGEL